MDPLFLAEQAKVLINKNKDRKIYQEYVPDHDPFGPKHVDKYEQYPDFFSRGYLQIIRSKREIDADSIYNKYVIVIEYLNRCDEIFSNYLAILGKNIKRNRIFTGNDLDKDEIQAKNVLTDQNIDLLSRYAYYFPYLRNFLFTTFYRDLTINIAALTAVITYLICLLDYIMIQYKMIQTDQFFSQRISYTLENIRISVIKTLQTHVPFFYLNLPVEERNANHMTQNTEGIIDFNYLKVNPTVQNSIICKYLEKFVQETRPDINSVPPDYDLKNRSEGKDRKESGEERSKLPEKSKPVPFSRPATEENKNEKRRILKSKGKLAAEAGKGDTGKRESFKNKNFNKAKKP